MRHALPSSTDSYKRSVLIEKGFDVFCRNDVWMIDTGLDYDGILQIINSLDSLLISKNLKISKILKEKERVMSCGFDYTVRSQHYIFDLSIESRLNIISSALLAERKDRLGEVDWVEYVFASDTYGNLTAVSFTLPEYITFALALKQYVDDITNYLLSKFTQVKAATTIEDVESISV